MKAPVRLREGDRAKRRTVADAVDIVVREFSLSASPSAQIAIGPLPLPSGRRVGLVDVNFPDFGRVVSLPTSILFKARNRERAENVETDIFLLDGAKIGADLSVVLTDGTRLRAVEVIPAPLPYSPSELDKRILKHVIAFAGADHCYRSIREGLPPEEAELLPDMRAIDYSRVREIKLPAGGLKVIRGYITDNDPTLKVSMQKISDTLSTFGIRRPHRRPRRSTRATI